MPENKIHNARPAADLLSGPLLLIVILTLWLAGLGGAAQFAKVGVQLAEIARIYPDVGSGIGWMVSLISLLGLIMGLFAGMLASRTGLRQLLLVSLVLGAVLSIIQSILPPFPVMLGLRILEGLSHLGIVVAAPTLIGTLTPARWRPAAMTLWGTFFGVAFTIVAVFGLPIVDHHGSQSLFILHGVWMGLSAIALYFLLPTQRIISPQNAQFELSIPFVLSRHLEVYRSPFIAAPSLGWLFYTFTFVALVTVLPQIVEPQHRAMVAASMPMASIVVSLTLGVVLLRHVSAITVVSIGFALAILIAGMMLMMPGNPYLPAILFGALGLVQGASFAAVPQLNSDGGTQALANGGMAQMGNLGNMTGTPILLAILAAFGPRVMIMLVIFCYVAGIAVHLFLAWRRQHSIGATSSAD